MRRIKVCLRARRIKRLAEKKLGAELRRQIKSGICSCGGKMVLTTRLIDIGVDTYKCQSCGRGIFSPTSNIIC